MKLFIIILIVLAVMVIGFFISQAVVSKLIFKGFFERMSDEVLNRHRLRTPGYDNARDKIIEYSNKVSEYPYKDIYVTSFDNLKLHARMYDGTINKVVIMFHGVHSIPLDNFAYQAYNFLQKGYKIVIVDERAHSLSEGKYISYGANERKDVITWTKYIRELYPDDIIILYGMSMGATSVALASNNKELQADGLIIDCGFTSTENLLNFILNRGQYPSFIFMPTVRRLAKRKVGITFNELNTKDFLKEALVPCLFIQGSMDDVVPESFTKENYEACGSKKELIIVEEAYHTTAVVVGGEKVMNQLIRFIDEIERK